MAAVQEIPPPEPSPERRLWPVLLALVLLALGVLALARFTAPKLPAYEWSPHLPPPGRLNLDSLVGMPDGFAMLSGITPGGVLLWANRDEKGWESLPLTGTPTQLASIGDSLVAYGIREGSFLSSDGHEWSESKSFSFPAEARSRQDSGRPSIVGNDDGILIVGLEGDIWWTGDGLEYETVVVDPEWGHGVEQRFDPRCNPPRRSSPDVPPLVATDTGFRSLVSTNPAEPFGIWPACEPGVWTSDDGVSWDATDSALTDGAYVYDLDWRAERFIAVGGVGPGRPIAWTSHDGLTWDELPTITGALGANLYRVDAGGAGWVVLGRDEMSRQLIGWTSVDGLCWERFPEDIRGTDVAVSQDQLLVFDRGGDFAMWTARPTGHRGACT